MSDHSKRTRSQLTLPEEFGEVHFGISPLRAARQERRRNLQADPLTDHPQSPAHPNIGVGGDESDDELLLSPPKARLQKRPPLSQQPGVSLEGGPERQLKRFKQDHRDELPHIAISEAKQPSGPFDFSSINPNVPSFSTSPGQKPRAHTVPLVSPTVLRWDLGQLMPAPGEAHIVPHVREVLRFSSLPHSRGPLDNIAKLSGESKQDLNLAGSCTPPPPPPESDSSLCKSSITEVMDSLPSGSLEVIPSSVAPSISSDVGAPLLWHVVTFTFA
ncbi:hypothetical protein F5148DRAFT_218134 [Russula earlei]|uniref:Uncharacterized protein n=1 Tax=Russula earlei TaxID=71964 RepID=A0ACC0U494_9AGAM|nr:hypothetical protein F5148DRAFT_218134 [Russula earlei]